MIEFSSLPRTNIGERLRQVRKKMDLNQSEFADAFGVTLQTISRYERGTRVPDGDFLLVLKEQANVSIDWLLTGIGDPVTGNSPYIPNLLKGCVMGVVLTFEKHDQAWTLKRLADEIDTEYQRLLPRYADGKTPIVELDETTIEALRPQRLTSKLA